MSKTKADVLSSAEDIVAEVEGLEEHDWFPKVRALNDAEFSKCQAKMFRNQRIGASRESIESGGDPQEQITMDLGVLIDNEFEARVAVVATGMVEEWTEEEVRRIPFPGAIEAISDKVLELGGHDLYGGLKKEVRRNVATFRSERGRAGDGSASDDGDTSREEPVGDDNGSEALPDDSHGDPAQEATG